LEEVDVDRDMLDMEGDDAADGMFAGVKTVS
jgi:hypothetical protein